MTDSDRGRRDPLEPAVDELAIRVQWVIDKVWVTVRVRDMNGAFHELPAYAMEWPMEPHTLSEWRDVAQEALSHRAPSLTIP